MSKNIVEDLPARKHAPAATPVKSKSDGKGSVEEGSEKKIRQAVYDLSLIHISEPTRPY